MKAQLLLTALLSSTAAASGLTGPAVYPPEKVFENTISDGSASFRIPTSYESAVMGRRILALTKLGTLATIFPESGASPHERRPEGLGGVPIGLMDYFADCEEEGNPTVLAITIATTFKNAKAGSNVSLSMQWTPPYPPAKRISFWSKLFGTASDEPPDTVPYSAANLPRFSLLGYIEKIPLDPAKAVSLSQCFVHTHPDSKYWLPGNPIHHSEWVRLVVTQVYWIGGFGDRAYIGWIPLEEWQKVTRKEWESIELPGEKKDWKEWSVEGIFAGDL
jgi:hypothetical protein